MPGLGWEDTQVHPASVLWQSQPLPLLAPSLPCLTPTPLLTIQDHLQNKPLALESLPRVLLVWEPKLNQPRNPQCRVQQQGHSETIS